MRLLLVEDDVKIAHFILNGLKEAGFAVDHTTNGEDGFIREVLREVIVQPPDIAFAVGAPVADEDARHGVILPTPVSCVYLHCTGICRI